ncbi:MAG: hypothetical protein LBH62_04260 [Nitrososphaerota archaeon]|jgi:hypothetical protein|nr:hypothetical protein [Nitrososphaerota archaeon]
MYKVLETIVTVLESIAILDSNIPTIVTSFGLALLAILIPLMIAIVQDIWMKRNQPNPKDNVDLDLHIILDDVFKFKNLLIYSGLIFLPFIFWKLPTNDICLISIARIIELVIAFIGILYMGRIIRDTYNWIKTDPTLLSFRKKYLEKVDLKNNENNSKHTVITLFKKNKYSLKKHGKADEFVKIWGSVLKTELSSEAEEEYFKIFIDKISKPINTETNAKAIENVFSKFVETLNVRTNNFHTFIVNYNGGDLFTKILMVHLESWRKANNQKSPISETWSTIQKHVCQVICKIGNKMCNNYHMYSAFLQKYFEFIEKHKDEKVTSNSYTYVYVDVSYSLFFEFLLTFNTSTRSSFNDQTRKKFESECQITIDTFKERKQFVILGLDQFSKIVKAYRSPSDVPINLVRFLFPEVNLRLWYLILTFKFAQDVNKSGIQSVIDLPFFKDTREDYQSMQSYSSNRQDYQQRMDERQKTCELAVYLFENEFSQELLDQYINEAQQQNDIKTKDYLIELFSCLKRVKHT